MENLMHEETPPPGAAQMPPLGAGLPPQQNQQLPPQMFTTAAQLLDMTDSKDYNVFLSLGLWLLSVRVLESDCVHLNIVQFEDGGTRRQRQTIGFCTEKGAVTDTFDRG